MAADFQEALLLLDVATYGKLQSWLVLQIRVYKSLYRKTFQCVTFWDCDKLITSPFFLVVVMAKVVRMVMRAAWYHFSVLSTILENWKWC